MDSVVDQRDYKLLEQDKYTFSVLRRIMGGQCELLLTDHERLILCFTCRPYPVWIWAPDNASDEEMERAYRLAEEHGFLQDGHRFNLKYGLAQYFMEKAAAEGKSLSISTNMFAYDCPAPIEPARTADGSLHRCGREDLEELVDFMELFHREVGIDKKSRDDYRRAGEADIRAGNMFLWKNGQGKYVASCKYELTGELASIHLVFTRPEYRRRHYAENLVYQVTKLVTEAGYVPTLYTDADYAASNACYEKIGYVLRGKLCTIG